MDHDVRRHATTVRFVDRLLAALRSLAGLAVLVPAVCVGQPIAPAELRAGASFAAADSLDCQDDDSQDARQCLANLAWKPSKFTVDVAEAVSGGADWLVRFPSPRPVGVAANDLAAMEWFAARDAQGDVRHARAVVLVHESGRRMQVARLIAGGLSAQGVHAFLLHLPGYGARRVEGIASHDRALPLMQQAIADVRRARDAVAVLPQVDPAVVGLQGTSLGGFVTATVAGLDRGYDRTFILLAGGNVHEVVLHGGQDAAKTREKLFAAGATDEQIKSLAREVEPLRLAHRINSDATWLYSGKFDDVVPPRCSLALARAARLQAGHHIELPADHYSGILYLPQVVQEIYQRMIEPLE